MNRSFYYISDGKLFKFENEKETEIRSFVLDSYLEKVKDSAKRSEWKYNGSGAEFTGTYRPNSDAESAVNAVYSRITSVAEQNGDILYSLEIDRTNGIYRKSKDNDKSEGIVLCSFENKYYDFDVKDGKIAVSVYFAGESNIGVYDIETKNLTTYTEGHTIDRNPVFDKNGSGRIFFTSTGLPESEVNEPKTDAPKGYSQMVSEMYDSAKIPEKGPTSICLLDTNLGTLSEFLSDERYDFVNPLSAKGGSFYYIRRPYNRSTGANPLGFIGDVLMFPVRIVSALFSFLNVFSATYSGKTLNKGSNVKNRDKKQTFIDGNLINAERELKENARRGDKNPGIIPHSWELHKIDPDGCDSVIKRGVLAYTLSDDGEIIFSNGSSVIAIRKDGKEEKILTKDKVTFIR